MAANQGGGEIPLNLAGIGMEGIAIIGINAFLRGNIVPGTLIPLLDELLECVTIIRDPKRPDIATLPLQHTMRLLNNCKQGISNKPKLMPPLHTVIVFRHTN
jgi:hypothetical protein